MTDMPLFRSVVAEVQSRVPFSVAVSMSRKDGVTKLRATRLVRAKSGRVLADTVRGQGTVSQAVDQVVEQLLEFLA